MPKSIKQVIEESNIRSFLSDAPTQICIDCMNGFHEKESKICECSCHNNPTCFVCGEVYEISDDPNIKDCGAHANCFEQWNDERRYKIEHEGY